VFVVSDAEFSEQRNPRYDDCNDSSLLRIRATLESGDNDNNGSSTQQAFRREGTPRTESKVKTGGELEWRVNSNDDHIR
jgi:hypothetical protein